MTKEEFLTGVIFWTTYKRNGFRFISNKSIGYLEWKNDLGLWVYYGHIDKINSTHISISFMGLRKTHRERIRLSELKIEEKSIVKSE